MELLSQSKSKLFASLLHKKYRYKHRLFIAEGAKCVKEAILSDAEVIALVIQEGGTPLAAIPASVPLFQASAEQFGKLTDQPNPEGIMAVLQMPEHSIVGVEKEAGILLDGLQDPGNVGAIMRVADWFGIRQMIAGPGTVDLFHPKVVRASMGSIFRMKINILPELSSFMNQYHERLVLADLRGTSLRDASIPKNGILIIGNEANGSSEIFTEDSRVRKIRIPGGDTTESLNAAVAAGIMIWEWKKS